MSEIWSQSLFGKRIDMVEPRARDVDFREICLMLANQNRYNGAASPSVSVAFHTMIVCDLSDEEMKPHALLHDCHEAFIGDISVPAAQALERVAIMGFGEIVRGVVRESIAELKSIHDWAIYAAAGVELPSGAQKERLKIADCRALRTERRDFMREPPERWQPKYEDAIPAERIYLEGHFGWRPQVVAERLYGRMERYFPALSASALAGFGDSV